MLETVVTEFATTSSNDGSTMSIGKGLVAIGAGISMIGGMTVGLGQGYSAGKTVEAIGRNPEVMAKVRTTMIIGAAIAESSAIYALVISILLIFVFQ